MLLVMFLRRGSIWYCADLTVLDINTLQSRTKPLKVEFFASAVLKSEEGLRK